MKRSDFDIACMSCLTHDLRVAFNCLQYHVLNKYNPFSVYYHDDLKVMCDMLDSLISNIRGDV